MSRDCIFAVEKVMFSTAELIFNTAELKFNTAEHRFSIAERRFLLMIKTIILKSIGECILGCKPSLPGLRSRFINDDVELNKGRI